MDIEDYKEEQYRNYQRELLKEEPIEEKERFEIQRIVLSDSTFVSIFDNEFNITVCDFITENGIDYNDKMAEKIVNALNS